MMETNGAVNSGACCRYIQNAAAIDIGGTVHVAAVRPRARSPTVRSFGRHWRFAPGLLIGSHSAGSRRS